MCERARCALGAEPGAAEWQNERGKAAAMPARSGKGEGGGGKVRCLVRQARSQKKGEGKGRKGGRTQRRRDAWRRREGVLGKGVAPCEAISETQTSQEDQDVVPRKRSGYREMTRNGVCTEQ